MIERAHHTLIVDSPCENKKGYRLFRNEVKAR